MTSDDVKLGVFAWMLVAVDAIDAGQARRIEEMLSVDPGDDTEGNPQGRYTPWPDNRSLGARGFNDEDVERAASAAFEWDRRNGHHKGGPWTWHMIPAEGQENYRNLVRAVLAELSPVPGVVEGREET
jgi:hypothetical protein